MDSGGTVKSSFYPIKVPKDYRYMIMDLTSAVRAVYIPVSQKFSTEFEEWCSYAHVSFVARGGSDINFHASWNYLAVQTIHADRSLGLGINDTYSIGLDLVGLQEFLTMDEYFRDEKIWIYDNEYHDPKYLLITWWARHQGQDYQGCKVRGEMLVENGYCDGIGYDQVISANSGLDLQYVPTDPLTSWVSTILSIAANVVGRFIPPIIGPMMHLAMDEALMAITDPKAFRTQNPLDLATDVVNTAIDTGQGASTYADQKKLDAYQKGQAAQPKPTPMLLSPQYFPGRVKEEE